MSVQNTEIPDPTTATVRRTGSGVGRVLVAVYGILAIAATGRSVFQIIDRFAEAPLAFLLSAFSGVIYLVATIALGARLRRLAWITISIELMGVLVVGTLSLVVPAVLGMVSLDPFGRDSTVWSAYGAGYLLVPLVLPVLGLLYLHRDGRRGDGHRGEGRGGEGRGGGRGGGHAHTASAAKV